MPRFVSRPSSRHGACRGPDPPSTPGRRYRDAVLLAELEVFHSRPIAPTRRVALGISVLPTSPPPGFGGLLLGGIVATFITEVDPDLHHDLVRLTHQVEQGMRIPQPRLRHRFQADRVGLNRHRHRLVGTGEELLFDLDRGRLPGPPGAGRRVRRRTAGGGGRGRPRSRRSARRCAGEARSTSG